MSSYYPSITETQEFWMSEVNFMHSVRGLLSISSVQEMTRKTLPNKANIACRHNEKYLSIIILLFLITKLAVILQFIRHRQYTFNRPITLINKYLCIQTMYKT